MIDMGNIVESLLVNCITGSAKELLTIINRKTSLKTDSHSNVFARLVDSKEFIFDKLEDYYSGHIDNSLSDGSVILLAINLRANKKIHVEKFAAVLVPANDVGNVYIGEYISNKLTFIEKGSRTPKIISINSEDDFFTYSTINNDNQIYIFPFIISQLLNANIKNFSEVRLMFCDQDDKMYCVDLELNNCIQNKKYIEQRITLDSVK